MLLVARLVLPFSFESGLHLDKLFPAQAAQTQTAAQTSAVQSVQSANPVLANTEPSSTRIKYASVASNSFANKPAQNQYSGTTVPIVTKAANAFNPYTAIVIIWLSGAVAFAVYLCAVKWRFNRRILLRSVHPNAETLSLFAACKNLMGVRGKVRLRVVHADISPGLTMLRFKPVVLIPSHLLGGSQANLRYAMLHELAHYRRRDHIMCLIIAALRCVYWFNPLIHIGFSEMIADMETASDFRVLSTIGESEKRGYLTALIDMFSQNAHPALAMAKFRTKRLAQKRLQGAFMAHKTQRGVLFIALPLAIILFIGCFTTACQPTPEREVVVNKAQGLPSQEASELKNVTEETLETPQYEVPEKWTQEIDADTKRSITIDAQISVPDTNVFPVYRLERDELTQERLDELIAYFAPGASFYAADVFTKEFYQQQLIEAKRGTLVDGEYIPPEDDDPYIASIEDKVRNAPEENEVVPASTKLSYYRDYDGTVDESLGENFLDVRYKMPNGQGGFIYATRHGNGSTYENSFSISSQINAIDMTTLQLQGVIPADEREMYTDEELKAKDETNEMLNNGFFDDDNYPISEEEAIAQVTKAFDDLNIEDIGIVSIEKALVERYSGMAGFSSKIGKDKGYSITCTRKLGDIDGYKAFSGSSGPDEEEIVSYTPPFFIEFIEITVTENGIEAFGWSEMAKTAETVYENTELLPFEEVKERMLDQIKFRSPPYEEEKTEVNITSMRLVSTYINTKDDLNSAWHIPVWVAEGSVTHTYGRGDTTGSTFVETMDGIVISALDGALVNMFDR